MVIYMTTPILPHNHGDIHNVLEAVSYTHLDVYKRQIVFMFIFLALTAWVVYLGVEKGIEKYSRILMPILLILIIGIAIFSLTLSYETEDGTVRTGLHGLAIYLIPNVEGLTVKRFLEILLDAMSQLFFSLSVSMGIMITYGSYVKDLSLIHIYLIAQIKKFL